MPDSSPNFSRAFREALLQLLWRQWSSLGVAGVARAEDDRVVDPEALLLVSTILARHDARLFDEMLDWLTRHGERINLQRLKRQLDIQKLGDATVLAALATRLCRTAALRKWAPLAAPREKSAPEAAARPLFLWAESTDPMPTFGRKDPDFLAHGWARPPVEIRGLSVDPSPSSAPAFLLRLRAFFGVQARAELIAALLARESATPAELARLTGYTPRTAELALRDLAASGLVYRHRQGREHLCRIRREDWAFLRPREPAEFPRWIEWPPLYAALLALLVVSERQSALSPLLFASELRQVIRAHAPALANAGLRLGADEIGPDFVSALFADLRDLLGERAA